MASHAWPASPNTHSYARGSSRPACLQASRPASQKVEARPLSRLERDFKAGDLARIEHLFTKFYWKHFWTSMWSTKFMRCNSSAVQWTMFMAATTLFVIVGTPYFAIDTVWLLTTWAIYIVKKMAGMPSAITAWARNVRSTIQSRFLSLTNWIKNAWALLQHNLIQVVDF